MLLQQSAQLGVIRSQGSLCVIHTAMIVDREDVRQAMRPGSAYATARDRHSVPMGRRASVMSFRTIVVSRPHATTATRGGLVWHGRLDAVRVPRGADGEPRALVG